MCCRALHSSCSCSTAVSTATSAVNPQHSNHSQQHSVWLERQQAAAAACCCTIHQLHEQSSSSCTTASRTCHCSAHLAHSPNSEHQACQQNWPASPHCSVSRSPSRPKHMLLPATHCKLAGSAKMRHTTNHFAPAAVFHCSTRPQQHHAAAAPHTSCHAAPLNAHIYCDRKSNSCCQQPPAAQNRRLPSMLTRFQRGRANSRPSIPLSRLPSGLPLSLSSTAVFLRLW